MRLLSILLLVLAALGCVQTASAAQRDAPAATPVRVTPTEAQTLDMLLASLPGSYARADALHDTGLAAPIRLIAGSVRGRVREARVGLATQAPSQTASALRSLDRLARMLAATDRRFQPWPLTLEVNAVSARARSESASPAMESCRRLRSSSAAAASYSRA